MDGPDQGLRQSGAGYEYWRGGDRAKRQAWSDGERGGCGIGGIWEMGQREVMSVDMRMSCRQDGEEAGRRMGG